MSDRTLIEWTHRTWNPVTGCTKVSPGCDNCYIETQRALASQYGVSQRTILRVLQRKVFRHVA